MVGEADPDDDTEANASLQIYLLGLPLRPLHLFTSMGDLIDFYWSGAGQEKTTLLEGIVPLERTEKHWSTIMGVKVRLLSDLSLHVHTQGEASISIWDSSGGSSLHTALALHGSSRVEVVAPVEVQGAAFLSTSLQITTGIRADTQVRMGSGVKACVVMSSDSVQLRVGLQGR